MVTEVKLDSMFRIQTLLLLKKKEAKSGYDLAKELEQTTGKKPSSGKLYPFLHELRDNSYIEEIEDQSAGARSKSSYRLTDDGASLVSELLDRMSNILDARLEQLLDSCHHCGVRLYESKVTKTISGKELLFCCEHCMSAFLEAEAH
ncbi:MAG: PadR family transcriptional regulator [Candidatus Heimdallarchaeota archaeon]|nr:PadR family transcriptional regulator [Candidatus Heimdallarchaeota archaeon]